MQFKFKKILLAVVFISLFACQSEGPMTQLSDAAYPSLFLNLEATNISGALKVYDSQGSLKSETALVISNDLVSSESIDLKTQAYYFVLGFYYTLDDGSLVGVANVVLNESLSAGNTQLSYQETDIIYDNPEEINNDLSASFSLGVYEITNLDLDGDGVSNIREILAGSNPLDAADLPDTLSVNLTEGQIVQDTVTIIAQYFPSEEAQALFMESPDGFEDQNGLADIFLTAWDTTEYPEDETVKLSFLAQNNLGELTEKNLNVVVDNNPNVTLEALALIQNGESVTLSWNLGNYTNAEVDQQIGKLSESSGSLSLTPTESRTYTLTAVRENPDGENFSTQKSVTIVVNDPPVFTGSTTDSLGQNPSDEDGFNFSWQSSDANSDVLDSTVTVFEGEGCVSDVVAEQSTTSNTLNMTGLLPRMTYSWRVMISDGKEGQAESECESFITGDEGLLAWWPMDEGAGNTLADLSGNEYDWTLSGGSSKPAWDSGVSGTGLAFDGVDDVSALPSGITTNAISDLSQNVSFDFWVYLDPEDSNLSGKYSFLLANIVDEKDFMNLLAGGGYGVFYDDRPGDGGRAIKFFGITADETYFEARADDVVETADWYHVTATYDANAGGLAEARLYINGDLRASDHFDDLVKTNSTSFIFGDVTNPGAAVNFSGSMDELAIYTRALNANEVREFCTRMGTGNCAASDTPVLVSPAPGDALSPTEIYFSWESGTIPENLSIDHFILCYTSGSESSLDDEDECANRTVVYGNAQPVELDPGITSTQTYYWKVKTCYDAPCTQSSSYSLLSSFSVDDSVQGLWLFDEGSGAVSENETGDSSLNATVFGSPVWQGSGVTGAGSAIDLDGVDDYVIVSNAVMSGLANAMSFEIWVYMDPGRSKLNDTYAYLMANTDESIIYEDLPGSGGYGLYFDDRAVESRNNSIRTYAIDDVHVDKATTSIGDEAAWYHIVAVYDSLELQIAQLYVNGELVSEQNFSSTVAIPTNNLSLGAIYSSGISGYKSFFNGMIDNVAVYDRALSDVEVVHHYCSVLLQAGDLSEQCE